MMEIVEKAETSILFAPASPSSQYLNSKALSLAVVAVMESEVPLDESLVIQHMINNIVPLNTRFSSVMVSVKGSKKWKRVDVQFEEHFIIPNLESGKSIEYYDEYITEYMSKVAMEPWVQTRPLWEVHILKCPTSNAAGGLIICKFHHALGDGHALMGLILSGQKRVDNPLLPLRFPSREPKPKSRHGNSVINCIQNTHQNFKRLMYTLSDFSGGVLKSKLIKDDETPIRSGDDGVEFRPIVLKTMTFSLDSIKQIKDKLNVTINDVITGIITMGTRLYMQGEIPDSSTANCTALVLLNTRALGGYKSVSEMLKPTSGNNFAFLHIPVTKLDSSECSNPLNFIWRVHKMIKKKRNSAAVKLTGRLLETLRRIRGPEATAKYVHGTLKNSSMLISNMIGPVDQMACAGHPIKGLYFYLAGSPQSLAVLIVSYMGNLRVAVAVEKDLIDPTKFTSCMDKAFQMIHKEAVNSPIIKKP